MFKYRKTIIAVMSGFLALLLIISFVAMALPPVRVSAASSLNSLKSKKTSLQSQKDELANELTAIQADKNNKLSEKSNLDAQIEVLNEQISTSEQLIAALGEQIVSCEAEIAEAEVAEAEEFELFKKRVRAMEESGTTSYLGVILGAESFSDMLARVEVITDIMTYDRELMAELKATRERKEEAKAELEASLAENESIQAELVSQRKEASDKSAQVDALLAEIDESYQLTSSEIAALESDISAVQKEIAKIEEEQRKAAQQSKYVGGDFLWPLPSPYYTNYLTQGFKYRVHQFTGKYGLHGAIDIGCPKGTNIYAANDGTVVTSTYIGSYGNYVMIDHGGNVYTLYAHMSQRLVSKGDKVTRGQVIGKVGSTGYSSGPHLHFEIRENGTYVDPLTKFK